LVVDSGCELFEGVVWDELITLLIFEELLELEELLEKFSMKDPFSNIYKVKKGNKTKINNLLKIFFK
jgi:predicted transcriptional regulator